MQAQVWSQISCLSIFVVLIGSADALHPKKPLQTDASDDAPTIDANNSNHEIAHVSDDATFAGTNNMDREPGEYHRAAHVKRGECTKRLDPSLLFIGMAHSGSTSLSDQMQLHPELSHGDTKEHQYFKRDYRKIQSNKWWEHYQESFWVSCNTTVAFDASMDYLEIAEGHQGYVTGEESVEYVKRRLGGNTKIIVMFRDPVDEIFHKQCMVDGKKLWKVATGQRPFTLDKPPNVTNQERRPSSMLSTWLKVFPTKRNWLFISSDDYFADPKKILYRVFDFVGVKPMVLQDSDLQKQSGRRRCNLKPTSEERKAYWSVRDNLEDKKMLERKTGLQFHWNEKS